MDIIRYIKELCEVYDVVFEINKYQIVLCKYDESYRLKKGYDITFLENSKLTIKDMFQDFNEIWNNKRGDI